MRVLGSDACASWFRVIDYDYGVEIDAEKVLE
jgi:hypothetical protein